MTNQLPTHSSTYDQSGQTIYGPQYNAGRDLTIQAAPLEPTRAIPPAPPPDFVGRTDQIAQLAATLAAGRSVAITALQGMGGIGKTALAQQLANQLTSQFSGGIFWAALADHNGNAEPILRTWGAFCGADLSQEPDPNGLADRVRGLLHQRRATQGALLAILDDVRVEWLNAALLLQRSLPAGVPLLLTLRDVDLATALNAEVVRLDVLPEGDAHKLLTARVKPKELLTPDETVKALLQQLGYLPLAIRLAGGYLTKFARKPGFTLANFVTDITQRALTLLDVGGGSGLAATFAISYAALTAEQQRIFRYCSVYSPALLTAEHIAGLLALEPSVVETTLDELVTVSLLDWDSEFQGHYILHPLLRHYGYDLLQKSEDVVCLHKRAAEHLQALLTACPRTPEEQLEEADQWEKAAEWSTFAQRTCDLVGLLSPLGYWAATDQRLIRAQSAVKTLDDVEHLEARLLHARSIIALKQGRWQEAITFAEQAVKIFEQLGDLRALAYTYGNLGLAYAKIGKWARAIEIHQQDLAISEQLGDLQGVAQSCGNLGSDYYRKGDWAKAISYYQRSGKIKEQLGDDYGLAQTYNNLGNVYTDKHNWTQATILYQKAIKIYAKLKSRHGLAQTSGNLGNVCYYQGEYEQATAFFEQATQIFAELGDPLGLAMAYANLGNIYRDTENWEQASAFYQKDLVISEQLGDVHGLAETYYNIALMHNRQGDQTQALTYYNQALQHFLHLGDLRGQAQTYNNLGNFYAANGMAQQALANYAQSLRVRRQMNDIYGIALTYKNLGVFYLNHDDAVPAAHYIACAHLLFAESQVTAEAQQTQSLLATILGSVDAANAYLAQLATGILPGSVSKEGQTLAQLLTLVTCARHGDHTLGEQLYHSFQPRAVDTTLSREMQALYKVLVRILAGINNPDLTALPTLWAEAVQTTLNQLTKT